MGQQGHARKLMGTRQAQYAFQPAVDVEIEVGVEVIVEVEVGVEWKL